MSATFLITLVLALMAIVYWRVVLILVGAFLIAMVLTGINSLSDAMAGQDAPPASTAPERPGARPDGGALDPARTGDDGVGPVAPVQPPR